MSADKRAHLMAIFEDFDIAMLHTTTPSGGVRGRPMALAEVQEDGGVYFSAMLGSDKVREIEADGHVAVSVQGKTRWATISGDARINRDRALIHKLWKESWKLWFPEGKDAPDLCLIEFDARDGEYWDNSGMRGVKFAVEAARAYLKGERADTEKMDENAKVKF